MIDPIDSLAFSMQGNKGVYAVLLGSGISRAASIPTGWEITLELVRKLAAVEGADCGTDPAAWYASTKDKAPDYSGLLDELAKTPTERQQLLRPYWEPTEKEREDGAKLPTAAHRAVADLVKLGYVRVVLTTNFDRLLETALHDVGIQPTVLSTPDHIEGALPLIHTPCTIIKIHGDYLDTRIRNTSGELAEYPEQFNKLLDRVFDEFGLIVSGWSADWDEALRAAMTRAPYRRFSTYWSMRGEPSEKAADLIARKGATLIKVVDADTFFGTLGEKVKALELFSRPHPMSTEVAVSSLKKYLPEPKYRIALNDLVSDQVDKLQEQTAGAGFDADASDVSGPSVADRLKAYEATTETLLQMAFVAGQWAEEGQVGLWGSALSKLSIRRTENGTRLWVELQRYPATLLFYAFGLGALQKNRLNSLGALCNVTVTQEYQEEVRVVDVLPIEQLFEHGGDVMKILPGLERHRTPLNNWLMDYLFANLGKSFTTKVAFELIFDRFEIVTALSSAISVVESGGHYWAPVGAFGWRHKNRQRIFLELRQDLANSGDSSDLIRSGLLGKSSEKGLQNISSLEEQLTHYRWH